MPKRQPYRRFTTAHDEIIHARDILAGMDRAKRAMIESAASRWLEDVDTGASDDGLRPTRFLLDMSGSMRGWKMVAALTALRAEGDRFDRAGVPFEILGYTTSRWRGGQSRQDWRDAERPRNPGRTSDLRHIVFKGMDESWPACRPLLSAGLYEQMLKENIDGEAIEWAMARAQDDDAPSALVMISDGLPCCDATFAVNPAQILNDHLEEVVERLDPAGIDFRRVTLAADGKLPDLPALEGRDILVGASTHPTSNTASRTLVQPLCSALASATTEACAATVSREQDTSPSPA